MAAQPDPQTALRRIIVTTRIELLELAVVAVRDLQGLATTDPEKLKTTLRSAWNTVERDYKRSLLHEPPPEQDRMVPVGVGLIVLKAYFNYSGDWPRMINSLLASIQSSKRELP